MPTLSGNTVSPCLPLKRFFIAPLLVIKTNFFTQILGSPMLCFAVHALLLRGFRRPGWFAPLLQYDCLTNQLSQPLQCVVTILFLSTKLLSLDNNNTVLADTLVVQRQKALLMKIGQRRGIDIEAQVDRRSYLVDVLATGTLCSNRTELDFAFGDADLAGNL